MGKMVAIRWKYRGESGRSERTQRVPSLRFRGAESAGMPLGEWEQDSYLSFRRRRSWSCERPNICDPRTACAYKAARLGQRSAGFMPPWRQRRGVAYPDGLRRSPAGVT
jgi:hypothetical protein